MDFQNKNLTNIYMDNIYLQATSTSDKINMRKQAKSIGYKTEPFIKDKPTKKYLKYLNKYLKETTDFKGNTIRQGKITKTYDKYFKEGAGEYNMKYNKFLQDSKDFEVDVNKDKLQKILRKMISSNEKIIMKFKTVNGNEKIYTLNKKNATRLFEVINDPTSDAPSASDEELIQQIQDVNVNVVFSKVKGKQQISGAFFKYTHNIKNLDLTDFQIYDDLTDISFVFGNNCCFIQALISAGVSENIINEAKHIIINKTVPMCKIDELCILLKLHITVQRIEDKKNLKHYPCDSKQYANILKKEPIKLGLIDEHYFHIKKTNITSYCIKNYEELKYENNPFNIRGKTDKKFRRDNNHFINSYDVIKLLLENKDTLLTPITKCNELYYTRYYDMINDITTLEYDDNNIKLVEFIEKEEEEEYVNVFGDFETITEGSKHIAYLGRLSNCNKRFESYSDGYNYVDCGKDMLYHLAEQYEGKNIRLIFHNAGYDLRFIFPYLTRPTLIERGKMLLRGYGMFYYAKNKYIKIQIQDSYALIAKPLRDFSKMFKVEMKKEILPYDIYTKENVLKVFVDLNECLESCKIQYEKNNIGKIINESDKQSYCDEFVKNCIEWKCLQDDNTVNIMKYSSKYCKADVDLLETGYNTFKKWMLDVCELNIDNYVSLPSVSQDYFMKQNVYENVYQLGGHLREFIQKCMVGGRTMCCQNKKHKINKTLADFDAVSLYPSAMYRLGGFLQGTPKILNDLSYDFLKKQDGYFVEIRIKEVNKSYKFPLMSCITNDGIRDFNNDMIHKIINVDKITLEELIKYHKIKFDIIRGYYFNEGRNYKLKDTIKHLFNTRLKAKSEGNAIQEVYKLTMNSSYGKTLLKPINTEIKYVPMKEYDEFVSKYYSWIESADLMPCGRKYRFKLIKSINKHFNLAQCGVEVLSMSKRIMNEVMCLSEDLDIDMYYTDTDSIHIENDKINYLAEEYKKINNRELIGKNMGQFHSDFDSNILEGDIVSKRSIFLGKKCYIDELISDKSKDLIDYHIRLKGVPNASILDKCEELEITPYELYERMYEGEEIQFDLTCRGKKINFEFNNAKMEVFTKDVFTRKIKF